MPIGVIKLSSSFHQTMEFICMDLRKIIELCGDDLTPIQRKYLDAVMKHGGDKTAAARDMGVCRGSIRQAVNASVKKATTRGFNPQHDMTHTSAPGYHVKGVSTYYGPDGTPKGQWVKTNKDQSDILAELRESVHELVATLPKLSPVKAPKHQPNDLMAVYPLGDPHIGMLSYGLETGQNWDLKIAEEKFLPVFDRLVRSAPQCDEATIIDLGDFWHADNIAGVTPASGHKLDMDGRFSKMIKVGFRILRRMIDSALLRHGIVNVVILPGNHDAVGSIYLREALTNIYENEPRVKVLDSVALFQYFRWGQVLVGMHHGHTCKFNNLPLVMAADKAQDWGECTNRYWYTGHIHHTSHMEMRGKEFQGCIVESFRTIAGPEAYSVEAGYRSGQDSKCIVLHKKYGEIARQTVSVDTHDIDVPF